MIRCQKSKERSLHRSMDSSSVSLHTFFDVDGEVPDITVHWEMNEKGIGDRLTAPKTVEFPRLDFTFGLRTEVRTLRRIVSKNSLIGFSLYL